jgi:hypothetical protein
MKTRSSSDRLVERYLDDLDRALTGLGASRRREVVEEVSGHIAEGRVLLGSDDEAGVRALLDRVGEPEAIAAEAGATQASTWSRRADAWVPWLLLAGGFAFVVGWFVGLGLLWSSTTWRVRDKLLGTFVLPGGLLPLAFLVGAPVSSSSCSSRGGPDIPTVTHCTTSGFVLPLALGIILVAFLLVAPIVTFIQLRRVRVGRS